MATVRSPRYSRTKGANGEREFRDVIREFGFTAERDGQTRVARWAGEPNLDVRHDIPGVHTEVKRQETYLIDKWLSQSEADAAREGTESWVCFRKSKQPWRVIVNARWLLGIMRQFVELTAERDWLVSRIDTRYADEYIELVHAAKLDPLSDPSSKLGPNAAPGLTTMPDNNHGRPTSG